MKKQLTPSQWAMRKAGSMKSSTRLVLSVMASYADEDGTRVFPSKATMARDAEVSIDTVKRAIRELLADGWIKLGDQSLVNKYRPDKRPQVYELNLDKEREDKPVVEVDEFGVEEDSSGGAGVPQRGIATHTPTENQPTQNEERGGMAPSNGGAPMPPNHTYTNHSKDGLVGSNYGVDSEPEKAHQQNDVDDLQEQMKLAGQTRRGWRPTDNALATAKASVMEVSIEISIARYAVVKAEKKQQPTSAEWLRWLLADEQKAVAEARRIQREKGKARPWHSVAD